jgi:subtilisin family serine protease
MVKDLFFKLFLVIAVFTFSGCLSEDDDQDTIEKPDTPVVIGPDPYDKYQWSFHPAPDYHYPGASSQAHSSITEAQNYNLGEGATVAIIDTCFDIYHEDVIHTNVIATKNMINGSSNVACEAGEETHGVLVFGVLGAQKYNSLGLVGVAPNAKYILIKIPTTISDADLVDAFNFAASHGADVISNSWGSAMESDTERALFADMKKRGISVVFACGNDGISLDLSWIDMECEDPSVIGVGASNEKNKIASYSNYGEAMDVLAPAGEHGVVTTNIDSKSVDILNTLQNPKYTYFAGTSAAAPLVAGVIALMHTAQPSLTPDAIRSALINSAEDVSNYKKVNAFAAIGYVLSH